MNELTIFFVVLFFVLAIVTVIGHGIWVLLAHVFGGKSPSSRMPPMPTASEDANRHACPRCGSPREPGQQVCAICNWPYASKPAADGMAALRALRRQLEVFGQQGLLDADAREQLNLAINEQEQRLLLAAPEADAPLAEVVDQTATIDSHPVAASTFAPLEGEPELVPVIDAQSSLTTSERAKITQPAAVPRYPKRWRSRWPQSSRRSGAKHCRGFLPRSWKRRTSAGANWWVDC